MNNLWYDLLPNPYAVDYSGENIKDFYDEMCMKWYCHKIILEIMSLRSVSTDVCDDIKQHFGVE